MANLEGKVAVVTGAGRGIGRAIALCFARSGADIAICARSGDDLREVSTDIQAMGRNCLVMAFDISNPDEVRIFCDKIISEFGKVDILVNNAGAYLERGAFI
ncbi:MAG: SDR family NAD(P)-dependent oxidoreductase, partial [Paracoccaceae bacterium]